MSLNRRDFIKNGGLLALSGLTLPSVFLSIFDASAESSKQISIALNYFGVTEIDLKKVITAALERGGDYADLFFEHTVSNSISLQDGAVNKASSEIDFGVGIRVISGDQTGYAYVENISLDEMLKAARTASFIANSSALKPDLRITEIPLTKSYYPVQSPWENYSVNNKIPYVQKVNDKIRSLSKDVIKVNVRLSDTTSNIMFCNSEGTIYSDYRPCVDFVASCVMQRGKKIENSYSTRSFRMGAEFLTDDIVNEIAEEVVNKTKILFDAIKPKGGEMPVVMGAGGSGILLHEAIGHAFEADFNRKNISIFSDKLNKKICNENISVVDDATLPFNRGSLNIDDEGIEGQKTYIVKNGVLTSYLHDRISAKHYGIRSTGNGRRESFRQMPIPRMRSTYMENGNAPEKDIIASVKKGIFVDNFTNGQVQIGAGDFTFFVSSGYLIENGKLTQPIKDINIIGNGPKALADISMVGNNFKMDNGTWTCGKDGQSCPVTNAMPTVLVNKLTVGGENV